ncbi:hypothetical protein RDI58_012534 [Solanum bulbocastanum]|uniref:Uncharacterized protein n=1 Tax=Solanum bulbocastanum TaxID=147425 RepID=A0AAN8TRV1_SOLBU
MSLPIIAAGGADRACHGPFLIWTYFLYLGANTKVYAKAGIDMQGLGAPEILQNFHSHPSCLEVSGTWSCRS